MSSFAVYSYYCREYYYREMISHSTLDLDQAATGNEVTVHWGDHGKRIKPIRATVDRFACLDLPSNRRIDLSAVPPGAAAGKDPPLSQPRRRHARRSALALRRSAVQASRQPCLRPQNSRPTAATIVITSESPRSLRFPHPTLPCFITHAWRHPRV